MFRRNFYLFFFLLTILSIHVFPSAAQNSADIIAFSSSFSEIGREALSSRTARIPVTWATVNRPLTANLVFEQVFADGSSINVELPRIIPYVASNGDGIAAPILPNDNADEIVLRVTLINLFNDFVYDRAEITLAIVNGNTGSGNSKVPALTNFVATNTAPVSYSSLLNGSARIPVSWSAINRPVTANLVFEQILPSGEVLNVELPRPFQWVNSSDSGRVAPLPPNPEAVELVLRVRLVDLVFNRTLDQRFVYVPIVNNSNPPSIRNFDTNLSEISADLIEDGSIWVEVSWNVDNRPANSNLVFEQVFPNGSTRNAELPRDFEIVPSSGFGVVVPTLPSQATDTIVFQLRLIDLNNNSTLASERLSIPLVDSDDNATIVVTGEACYQSPFPPSQGVAAGEQGRVQYFFNGSSLHLHSSQSVDDYLTEISAGEVFAIEESPYCIHYGNTWSQRRWQVNYSGQRAWVDEYMEASNDAYVTYYFVPANQDDIGTVSIESFSISPDTVNAADIATTDFTFSWETTNANEIHLSPSLEFSNTAFDASLTINGSDLLEQINFNTEQVFTLAATDTQGNSTTATVVLNVNSAVSIEEFTAAPSPVTAGEQVTFTWDIAGDIEGANIIWYPDDIWTQIHELESNAGSFAFTLPDNIAGDIEFTLALADQQGTNLLESITVTVDCAREWGLGIEDEDCPVGELRTHAGAYQAFQRGFMIWENPDSPTIWVFYNDGTSATYVDNWDNTDFAIDGTAPDGFFAPERGFGYLWSTEPSVRSGLGWATGGEQSYTISTQRSSGIIYTGTSRRYMTLPDNRLVQVLFTFPGQTWSFVD